MQIKTQLDIELNEADIKASIALYLSQNNVSVSDEELDAIKFVNSRNDGIKANLTVSNEKSTAPTEHIAEAPVLESIESFQAEATSTAEEAEESSEELVEASTVEDVMPSIDEITEQHIASPGKPTFAGKSLFGNK